MKNILVLFVFLLTNFYSFSQTAIDSVDWNQLEDRDDIWYKKGLKAPFSGIVVTFYPNGQRQEACTIVNGRYEGLVTSWHPNGQKKSESNRVNGKREGLTTTWDKNGKKRSEIYFKDGLPFSMKEWDEDGNKTWN